MADLVELEDYKEFVGIKGTTEDQKLSALISSVSTLIKTYCSRTFVDYYDTDKVELISVDYPSKAVQLAEYPIVSITMVEERAAYDLAYEELTTTDHEYYLDAEVDSIVKTNGGSGYLKWSQGPGSVRVTYKAGYASTPLDLKLAAFDLVTYYHKNEYKGTQTLKSATRNTPGTTTQWGNVSFPDHIKRVLDLYKSL